MSRCSAGFECSGVQRSRLKLWESRRMKRGGRRRTGSTSLLPLPREVQAVRCWWQRACRPLSHHASAFEVKPLETWMEIERRLKNSAMHIFQRREQRLLFLWQGNEPSRGSCNQSNPYHDGVPSRKSPKPLHFSEPHSLSHSPSLYPCLLVTLTLASGQEKSWERSCSWVQRQQHLSHFKNFAKIFVW